MRMENSLKINVYEIRSGFIIEVIAHKRVDGSDDSGEKGRNGVKGQKISEINTE